ncbi:hypothetical protein Tco_1572646, partial [Tanacetum coccineum]
MKGKAGKERREAKKEHDQQIHMVVAPGALVKDSSTKAAKVKVKVQHETSENRMEE